MNEMDTRFANQYNIQWFPGHMTKTLRMMEAASARSSKTVSITISMSRLRSLLTILKRSKSASHQGFRIKDASSYFYVNVVIQAFHHIYKFFYTLYFIKL